MKTLLSCLALVLTLPTASASWDLAWIDPETAAKENPDFLVQGEYFKQGAPHAAQVVALGKGNFDLYLLEGGLPGAGWEPGKGRDKISGGSTQDGVTSFESDKGSVQIKDGELTLQLKDQPAITLPRIERKSPTLGAKPPEGAVVLFDGSHADAWENGVVENGLLKANNTMSKQHFKSYTAHIEFRTPFKPFAQGQRRGNSGVYHQGRWETQILDSFALDGTHREAGGVYTIAEPRLNMCLPPLAWQTYDVDFTAATFDERGRRSSPPRITVKLNGVVIHDDLELNKSCTTAAPSKEKLTEAGGPIFLQDHNNPVYFRNIWVVPK